MTYMKLADGSEYPIADGAKLDMITVEAGTPEAAQAAAAAITETNLSHVEFFRKGDIPHGLYDDLHIKHPVEVDDCTVIISLTETETDRAPSQVLFVMGDNIYDGNADV